MRQIVKICLRKVPSIERKREQNIADYHGVRTIQRRKKYHRGELVIDQKTHQRRCAHDYFRFSLS